MSRTTGTETPRSAASPEAETRGNAGASARERRGERAPDRVRGRLRFLVPRFEQMDRPGFVNLAIKGTYDLPGFVLPDRRTRAGLVSKGGAQA